MEFYRTALLGSLVRELQKDPVTNRTEARDHLNNLHLPAKSPNLRGGSIVRMDTVSRKLLN